MPKIQVLGTGCQKCEKLLANAQNAAVRLGPEYSVEKVDDIVKIMEFGVMMTPALAVDGVVKVTGKILSPEEIIGLLDAENRE
jgi:small redox-active disulfide protein 2